MNGTITGAGRRHAEITANSTCAAAGPKRLDDGPRPRRALSQAVVHPVLPPASTPHQRRTQNFFSSGGLAGFPGFDHTYMYTHLHVYLPTQYQHILYMQISSSQQITALVQLNRKRVLKSFENTQGIVCHVFARRRRHGPPHLLLTWD